LETVGEGGLRKGEGTEVDVVVGACLRSTLASNRGVLAIVSEASADHTRVKVG